ncbi:MAG: LuxR C-terminal-related transcriptional regulator [Betaproteobacteria bacterium]
MPTPISTGPQRAYSKMRRDCSSPKFQSNKRIGKALVLSPETVKHHLKAIFLKLSKSTRKDAVAEARRRAVIA